MNKASMKIAALVIGISLVGCASNTRSENIALGVAAGAVTGGVAGAALVHGSGQAAAIAVGAVGGGLIGGAIGASMDSTDHMYMYHSMNTGKRVYWSNKHAHVRYKFVPTGPVMSYKGYNYCRNYQLTKWKHGHKYMMSGIACRQSDGSWITVN